MISLRGRLFSLMTRISLKNKFDLTRHSVEEVRKSSVKLNQNMKLDKNTKSSFVKQSSYSGQWISTAKDNPASTSHCILYVHSGGFVLPISNSHLILSEQISHQSSSPVFIVDYPLAPENKHPKALDAVTAAYHGLLEQGFEKIIICGDSSGGGLALMAAMQIKEQAVIQPLTLVLLSLAGSDGYSLSGESYLKEKRDPMNSKAIFHAYNKLYFTEKNERVCLSSLSGLPELFIFTGEFEVNRCESEVLQLNAERAKIKSTLIIKKSMWHVHHAMFNYFPEAKKSITEICQFMIKKLNSD